MAQTELTNVPLSARLAPRAAKARFEIKFRSLTEPPKMADETQESTLYEKRRISGSAVAKLQSDNFKKSVQAPNQCRRLDLSPGRT